MSPPSSSKDFPTNVKKKLNNVILKFIYSLPFEKLFLHVWILLCHSSQTEIMQYQKYSQIWKSRKNPWRTSNIWQYLRKVFILLNCQSWVLGWFERLAIYLQFQPLSFKRRRLSKVEKCILYLQWKSDSLVCKDMDQPKIRYETPKINKYSRKGRLCEIKKGKRWNCEQAITLKRSVSALLFKYIALTNFIRWNIGTHLSFLHP